MRYPLNRCNLILLALLVGLLPLNFSFSMTNSPGAMMHVAPMQDHSACDESVDGHPCAMTGIEKPAHDDCCGDHCDSSFGGHLFIAVSYGLQLPPGHRYQENPLTWIAGPIPPILLHPPQYAA